MVSTPCPPFTMWIGLRRDTFSWAGQYTCRRLVTTGKGVVMSRLAAACGALLILSTTGLASGSARAQAPAYPAKPIRMIIALAPGGGVDTTGRFIAQYL